MHRFCMLAKYFRTANLSYWKECCTQYGIEKKHYFSYFHWLLHQKIAHKYDFLTFQIQIIKEVQVDRNLSLHLPYSQPKKHIWAHTGAGKRCEVEWLEMCPQATKNTNLYITRAEISTAYLRVQNSCVAIKSFTSYRRLVNTLLVVYTKKGTQ